MFAGLPGIGVGTLFYVLTALWMPVRECRRLFSGRSTLVRWRAIGVQVTFALSIIASVAIADRVLVWILGEAAPSSVGPARWINGVAARTGDSVLAAPVTASLLILGGVLLSVELLRVLKSLHRPTLPRIAQPPALDNVLDS